MLTKIGNPVEDVFDNSVDKDSVDKPAPVSDTTDKPADKPADSPVSDTTDKPVDTPADSPVSDNTDKPVDKPADKPVDKLAGSPVSATTAKPVDGFQGLIQNFQSFDPFADADDDDSTAKQKADFIHIRIQQRNGRKYLTTVQGIPDRYNFKKILTVLKKQMKANGTIVDYAEGDGKVIKVIQLQGDQRAEIKAFLTRQPLPENTPKDTKLKDGLGIDESTIKMHGF